MLNDSPLISIIVPVYNVELFLDRCISSLVNQTLTNLDIILVDDGSPDNSGNICDAWAKKDNRITVIHKENAGVSAARNSALRIAKGDYVGFVDADDFVSLDMYECLCNRILETGAEIAACSWDNYAGDAPENQVFVENKSFIIPKYKDVLSFEDSLERELSKGIYITCNKIFSKEVCSGIFYNENYINGEDKLFSIMAICNSRKVAYDMEIPKYHYCHRPNSAGTKNYTKKDYSLVLVCQDVRDIISEKAPSVLPVAEGGITMAYVQLIGMIYRKKNVSREDGKILLFVNHLFCGYFVNAHFFNFGHLIFCVPMGLGLLMGLFGRQRYLLSFIFLFGFIKSL